MKEAARDVGETGASPGEDDPKTPTSSARASFLQSSPPFSSPLWSSSPSLSLRLLSPSLSLPLKDNEGESDKEEREIKLSDKRLV